MSQQVDEELTCVQAFEDGCKGEVEYRPPVSGSGRSFARCERHWGQRLSLEERVRRRSQGVGEWRGEDY